MKTNRLPEDRTSGGKCFPVVRRQDIRLCLCESLDVLLLLHGDEAEQLSTLLPSVSDTQTEIHFMCY